MAKCGFFKGIIRCNGANYGDLEGGEITKLKRGRLGIAIEKEKVLAWIVRAEDIELSKSNVQSLELISSNVRITDLSGGGGKPYEVNIYRITMKDGAVGTLRLLVGTEHKVLMIIK